MSGIRKLKRNKSLNKKKKTSTKLPLGGIILFVGFAMLLSGIFYGIYNYDVYASGKPEHTTESEGGSTLNPEETPGNPERRESAATGWTIAGIGIVLIVLSVIISIIDKLLHSAVWKLYGRTSKRRLLRKGK